MFNDLCSHIDILMAKLKHKPWYTDAATYNIDQVTLVTQVNYIYSVLLGTGSRALPKLFLKNNRKIQFPGNCILERRLLSFIQVLQMLNKTYSKYPYFWLLGFTSQYHKLLNDNDTVLWTFKKTDTLLTVFVSPKGMCKKSICVDTDLPHFIAE